MEFKFNIPKQKTTGFYFVGTMLFLGSVYLNYLKEPLAGIGIFLSGVTILISLAAQCVNWWIYWEGKDDGWIEYYQENISRAKMLQPYADSLELDIFLVDFRKRFYQEALNRGRFKLAEAIKKDIEESKKSS